MRPDASVLRSDPELIRHLVQKSRSVLVRPGKSLFYQGDMPNELYVVQNGKVSLTFGGAGKIILDSATSTGTPLGLAAVIANGPYNFTAEIITETEVHSIPSGRVLDFESMSGPLYVKLLEAMASEIQLAERTRLCIFSRIADISGG